LLQPVHGFAEDKYDSDKFKLPPKRLVSGGNDNCVVVWEFVDGQEEPRMTKIGEHSDWVRDVAWSNNIGLLHDTIASCSEDGTARVWRHVADKEGSQWVPKEVKVAERVPLWKASWS
jgi:protein transport protein SEC13